MSTTPSNEDQNSLHRVDIENSAVDIDEDQKVAEWAKSLGFINVGSQHEKPLYKKDDMYIVDTTQMTFFYKAQQADRKRLLDKVEKTAPKKNFKHLSWCMLQYEEACSCGMSRRNTTIDQATVALDQIRKEEL